MKYEIQGETLPVVICQLADGERMITEGGAMSWMSPNMKMETTSNGGIGKAECQRRFQSLFISTLSKSPLAVFAWQIPAAVVIYGSIFRSAMRILLEDKNQIAHIFRLK